MQTSNWKIVGVLLAFMLWTAFSFFVGKYVAHKSFEPETEIITRVDTIRITEPIVRDSIQIRTKYVKLPVVDTIYSHSTDTIIQLDSVQVAVPITQKEYADSTYTAWVSGFDAKLDSIYVYPRTTMITTHARDRPKRFGLGLQVGAGYGYGNKVTPYIGIGVSYNIMTW